MHVKSQSCIVMFDLLLQQLYGILGRPSYMTLSQSQETTLTSNTHISPLTQLVVCIY